MHKISRLVALVAMLAATVAVYGVVEAREALTEPAPALAPAAPADASVAALLDQVQVVSTRPNVDGYDRDCGPDHRCVFGPAWTDDHTGTGGHNGCDTRNDVLDAQMRDVTTRPGTGGCVVVGGTLTEPYTGVPVTFAKAAAGAIHIDHVYPLAMAWDMGAHGWTEQRRVDFANDQARNLLAVDAAANMSKGDRGPGEWLPVDKAARCRFVARFLRVAVAYHLPITAADADSIRHTATTC